MKWITCLTRAFGSCIATDELEIKSNIKGHSKLGGIADTEPIDFSQFVNYDTGLSSQDLSCLFDLSSPGVVSPIDSLYAITPSLPLSNDANNIQSPPKMAISRSSTNTEMSAESSRDVLEVYQQHGQDDSEIPRQLCLEPREKECSSSLPFTADQQIPSEIPAHIRSSSSFSPAHLLDRAPTPDKPSQRAPTPKRQCITGLSDSKMSRPGKKGQRSRKAGVHTREEVKKDAAAKRNKYLMRNRRAAHKCRDNKKSQMIELLRREEFFTANNAALLYEIAQTKLELRGLRTIAGEHCRACPCPSLELVTLFETDVVRLQQSKTTAPACNNNGLPTPLPQDSDFAGQRTADTLPPIDLISKRQVSGNWQDY